MFHYTRYLGFGSRSSWIRWFCLCWNLSGSGSGSGKKQWRKCCTNYLLEGNYDLQKWDRQQFLFKNHLKIDVKKSWIRIRIVLKGLIRIKSDIKKLQVQKSIVVCNRPGSCRHCGCIARLWERGVPGEPGRQHNQPRGHDAGRDR